MFFVDAGGSDLRAQAAEAQDLPIGPAETACGGGRTGVGEQVGEAAETQALSLRPRSSFDRKMDDRKIHRNNKGKFRVGTPISFFSFTHQILRWAACRFI